MHPKQRNHTICFQGSVLTTDKHSSDCGGNSFLFFLKAAVCAFVSEEPLTTTEGECM